MTPSEALRALRERLDDPDFWLKHKQVYRGHGESDVGFVFRFPELLDVVEAISRLDRVKVNGLTGLHLIDNMLGGDRSPFGMKILRAARALDDLSAAVEREVGS